MPANIHRSAALTPLRDHFVEEFTRSYFLHNDWLALMGRLGRAKSARSNEITWYMKASPLHGEGHRAQGDDLPNSAPTIGGLTVENGPGYQAVKAFLGFVYCVMTDEGLEKMTAQQSPQGGTLWQEREKDKMEGLAFEENLAQLGNGLGELAQVGVVPTSATLTVRRSLGTVALAGQFGMDLLQEWSVGKSLNVVDPNTEIPRTIGAGRGIQIREVDVPNGTVTFDRTLAGAGIVVGDILCEGDDLGSGYNKLPLGIDILNGDVNQSTTLFGQPRNSAENFGLNTVRRDLQTATNVLGEFTPHAVQFALIESQKRFGANPNVMLAPHELTPEVIWGSVIGDPAAPATFTRSQNSIYGLTRFSGITKLGVGATGFEYMFPGIKMSRPLNILNMVGIRGNTVHIITAEDYTLWQWGKQGVYSIDSPEGRAYGERIQGRHRYERGYVRPHGITAKQLNRGIRFENVAHNAFAS